MPRPRKAKPTVKCPVLTNRPTAKSKKRKATKNQAADSVVLKVNDEPSTSKYQDERSQKKVSFSGIVPVDEQCTLTGYHVYIDKDITSPFAVYNAMLNQTDIGANNNKYYILQVLEHDSKHEYATWFRWGRVGKVAGTKLEMHGSKVLAATHAFSKKFNDKTGNCWYDLFCTANPPPFKKQKGKYDMLDMDYGEGEENTAKDAAKSVKKEIPSTLDARVQNVVDLIFNIKEMEACVKEMEFDVKKAPLGKLTTNQINAGYETLTKIEKCIEEGDISGSYLAESCDEFYTRIPHDFGMKRPPLILTQQQLKQKIELLEALSDIQIAIQMIDEDARKQEQANVSDLHYKSLGCKLEPCDDKSDDYRMVKQYVTSCQMSEKTWFQLIVEDVFKVERSEDNERFKESLGNKMLLWHGSRLTNWCGILKQGLRIAPPEAPASGYSFGKGVYFADMVMKSALFCRATKTQPYGFLLLCEVALGRTNDRIHGNIHGNKLPRGKSSTKALGRKYPNPKGNKKLDCGTTVPLGKLIPIKNNHADLLLHNEYIVYDVAQIRARYLVKVGFKFGC